MRDVLELCTIKPDRRTGFSNGGWAYDAYPELETLDAYTSITIAEIEGPAVITCIHTIQHLLLEKSDPGENETERKSKAARGMLLEIYFNGVQSPSVKVPLADFFADGCCGQADNFGNNFVEKAPHSYNCFIPMPFEKSAKVVLTNETDRDYKNYSFVEYESLPSWDSGLGYFHATWKRFAFQLSNITDINFFHVEGCGHLIGRAWSICTDEPFFNNFHFVMEANNEFRIDGEAKQRLDYLGSEDSFTFSWGFQKQFCGPYAGMNFIKQDSLANINLLSIFRFMDINVIRFNKSLDLRVNWSKEAYFFKREQFMKKITEVIRSNHGWIDYSTVNYWYQKEIGYPHEPMMPIEDRCKIILKPNK
jgi:hypothetical protein